MEYRLYLIGILAVLGIAVQLHRILSERDKRKWDVWIEFVTDEENWNEEE